MVIVAMTTQYSDGGQSGYTRKCVVSIFKVLFSWAFHNSVQLCLRLFDASRVGA